LKSKKDNDTPYLIKRRGIFHLHKRVPTQLIEQYGTKYIRKSLRTRDKNEAVKLAGNLVASMEKEWKKQMRHEDYMRLMEQLENAGKEAYGGIDLVNSPPHYNQAGIECVDAIAAATDDGFQYYLQGNIIKYLWRYRYKNGIQDLEKAQWYLNKLIETLEEE